MSERREVVREDGSTGACLFFGGQRSFFPCAVRNMSAKGAQISLEREYALPKKFLLSFDGFQTARNCRLVWLEGNFFGVAFQSAADNLE